MTNTATPKSDQTPLTKDDVAGEAGVALPNKEAMSLLDVNAELDLALDLAAPIDAAVAANANIAAPIDAAVSANVLSVGSSSAALADQDAILEQNLEGTAEANATQQASVDQSDPAAGEAGSAPSPTESGSGLTGAGDAVDGAAEAVDGAVPGAGDAVGGAAGLADSLASGSLLDVNLDLALDADIAAPVDVAVAANANVAAPIDAAVSANIGSVASQSAAVADQDVLISQNLEGEATANATQDATVKQ